MATPDKTSDFFTRYPQINYIFVFILGWLSFAIAEEMWLRFFKFASSIWILEPTAGIAICALIIYIFSRYTGLFFSLKVGKSGPIIFFLGLMSSLVYYLFKIGAGNLWPFVIIIDSVITFPFVFIGWEISRSHNFKKTLLKYSTGEIIKAGDIVKLHEKLDGIIAFCKTNEEYMPEYPQKEWSNKNEVMVATEEKGLFHLEDLNEIRFLKRKTA